jgi:hypothetical protein
MTAGYSIKMSLDGKWVLFFLVSGVIDTSAYGTNGTGCKVYDTMEKAKAAGKRYLKRMERNGFKCDKFCF